MTGYQSLSAFFRLGRRRDDFLQPVGYSGGVKMKAQSEKRECHSEERSDEESVPKGLRIATASVRTGFAMTEGVWGRGERADEGIGPYRYALSPGTARRSE